MTLTLRSNPVDGTSPIDAWRQVRDAMDPSRRFHSDLSRRLHLTSDLDRSLPTNDAFGVSVTEAN